MFVVIEFAIDCMIIVLPALDGDTISPRWPLPIGAAMSITRPIRLVDVGLQAQPLAGVERRQLLELDPVLGGLRVGAVDRVELDQRVELLLALALAGLAHHAGDRVTAAQAVLADHRQRHVDVVGARQVAGGADERVVVEHVEDARARHQHVVLEDLRVRLVAVAAVALRGARGAGAGGARRPVTVPTATAPVAAAALLLGAVAGVLLALVPVLAPVRLPVLLLPVLVPVLLLPVGVPVLVAVLVAIRVALLVAGAVAAVVGAVVIGVGVGVAGGRLGGSLARALGALGACRALGALTGVGVGVLRPAVLVGLLVALLLAASAVLLVAVLASALAAVLGGRDRGDQVGLLHARGLDPEAGRDLLELGHQLAVQPASAGGSGPRRCLLGTGRRSVFDGFGHWGSFPLRGRGP